MKWLQSVGKENAQVQRPLCNFHTCFHSRTTEHWQRTWNITSLFYLISLQAGCTTIYTSCSKWYNRIQISWIKTKSEKKNRVIYKMNEWFQRIRKNKSQLTVVTKKIATRGVKRGNLFCKHFLWLTKYSTERI